MADDQTRKSFDDAEYESVPEPFESDPSGENLARHAEDGPVGDIMDDEAEELSGEPVADRTPGHADPEDMVIDDPQQLADAEAVAARARSSRPVRKKRSQSAAEQGAQGDAAEAATTEPVATPEERPSMPKPVRRNRPQPASQTLSGEASSASPVPAPVRKNRSARVSSSSSAEVAVKRTTPAAFVGQSVDELRKVIWPTSSQLSQYFVVVLLFVLFIVAYVGLLDPAFGWVLLKFLGK
ncbi:MULTISPECIES: preprotein translocase subunit SecE [unclassified Luteococcus]|uniref:preprotein translocase subunit SecE n=1 Tax=unclassified Luteococcus TaxID=2639923 RepID=UPI00313DF7B0